jgi:hypothetical protein
VQPATASADGQWLYFDEIVSDGKSIKAVAWNGSDWVFPVYDLRPQIGERASSPFITPSGDTLFFGSGGALGGFGGQDIFLSKRIALGKVSSVRRENLIFLVFVLILAGIYWIVHFTLKPTNK